MSEVSTRTASQQALIDEIWGTESDSDTSYAQLRKKYSQDLFDSSDFNESSSDDSNGMAEPVTADSEEEEATRTEPLPLECLRPGADPTTQYNGVLDDYEAGANMYRAYGGDSNFNWVMYLKVLKSSTRAYYENRVKNFFVYRVLHRKNNRLWEDLVSYFDHEHDRGHFSGTVFKSWLAIFVKFFHLCLSEDLNMLAPILKVLCKSWGKNSVVKKASTFSGDDLLRYFELPNNPDTLVRKVFAAISISFAGRGVEMVGLKFEDIRSVTVRDDKGKESQQYRVYFKRAKATVCSSSGEDYSTVSGEDEVKVINHYISCFTSEMKEKLNGRFFRKLRYAKDGSTIVGTNRVIGINSLRVYSKQVAKSLELPDPQSYTGHCWRRTSITFATEQGLSLMEIKALSGHKSDTVVQGYIEKGPRMREKLGVAVTLSGNKRNITEI